MTHRSIFSLQYCVFHRRTFLQRTGTLDDFGLQVAKKNSQGRPNELLLLQIVLQVQVIINFPLRVCKHLFVALCFLPLVEAAHKIDAKAASLLNLLGRLRIASEVLLAP